jgi:hypothetical protein
MESTAKGLVGREVVLTVRKKPNHPPFRRRLVILDVRNGFIHFKDSTGMANSIPLDDDYMVVEEIRAVMP